MTTGGTPGPPPPPGGDPDVGRGASSPGGPPPPQPGPAWGRDAPNGPPPAYTGPGWGANGPDGTLPGGPGSAGPVAPTNGAALAAAILGVASLILAVMGFVVLPLFLAVPAALVAIVLGVIGRRRARDGAPRGGQALTGLVTGIAGLVVSGIWIGVVVVLGGQFLDEFSGELADLEACIEETGDQDLCSERFSEELEERLEP